MELVRLREEQFSPERMVADYVRAFGIGRAGSVLFPHGHCAACGQDKPRRRAVLLRVRQRRSRRPAPSGEERRVVSVVFVDLVGFTGRAEHSIPRTSARSSPRTTTPSARRWSRSAGVVEKFIGDAVMAVFGAPTAFGDDAGARGARGTGWRVAEMNAAMPARSPGPAWR